MHIRGSAHRISRISPRSLRQSNEKEVTLRAEIRVSGQELALGNFRVYPRKPSIPFFLRAGTQAKLWAAVVVPPVVGYTAAQRPPISEPRAAIGWAELARQRRPRLAARSRSQWREELRWRSLPFRAPLSAVLFLCIANPPMSLAPHRTEDPTARNCVKFCEKNPHFLLYQFYTFC